MRDWLIGFWSYSINFLILMSLAAICAVYFLCLSVFANKQAVANSTALVEIERVHSQVFVEDLAMQIVYRVTNSLNLDIRG